MPHQRSDPVVARSGSAGRWPIPSRTPPSAAPARRGHPGLTSLRQSCCVERHRLVVRRQQILATEGDVRYDRTSLGPERADAQALRTLARGQWRIEHQLHDVRDVTCDDDRSQMRRGAAPQTFAACRNRVIGRLRRAGVPNIAAALRTCAARPADAAVFRLPAGRL